jgi:ribonuclease HI
MTLSPEVRKLLQQTLKIRGTEVPLHRIIDILATVDGDVSEAVNRYRGIKNEDLRRAFHNCAVLLRELEKEAGLRPAWEPGAQQQSRSGQHAGAAGSVPKSARAAQAASEPKKPAAPPKPRFSPQELVPFEDEEMRGKARIAKIYVDGASKGNPGPAGIGVAMFTMDGQKIAQLGKAIGDATNNIAEYTALIEALQLADRMGVRVVFVLSDSELMVKQMTGVYKIKNPEILQKVKEAQKLVKQFERFSINYVERENNRLADALSTSMLKKEKAPAAGPEEERDFMPPLEENPDDGATG